jgi:membrane protease YdiL (CAAX protease family)
VPNSTKPGRANDSQESASGKITDRRFSILSGTLYENLARFMQAAISRQASSARKPAAPASFRGEYWLESRRPLTSLAFVTPLLAVYEFGVLWLGPQAMRNGADVWLRQLLDLMGFSQYFLLPVLTLGLLAAWHYLTHDRWRISSGIMYAKFAECMVLALALVLVARVQANLQSLVTRLPPPAVLHAALGFSMESVFRRFVGFMGAGIYEELMFRLMLLPAIAAVLRWCGCKQVASLAVAAVTTSLIFAAAHHLGAQGEPFQWYAFIFRATAGLFFATLFLFRGFGIAAGTHTAYDMLVGLI